MVEPLQPLAIGPTPECSDKDQCEAMWVEAIEALQSATGMKIQTMSDVYLQTYTTHDFTAVSGSVRKIPLGGGRYAIQAHFASRSPGAKGVTDSMLGLFNLRVTRAGDLIKVLNSTQPAQ